MRGQKTSGEYAILSFYRIYLDLKSAPFWDTEAWKINFYGVHGKCIYFDSEQSDIAIDLTFVDNTNYKVEVFRRKLDSNTIKNDLLSLEQYLNWNSESKRYESNLINLDNCIELIKKIQYINFNKTMNHLLTN
ncbi:hypothetical protein D3C72_1804470 [compost metagenome]